MYRHPLDKQQDQHHSEREPPESSSSHQPDTSQHFHVADSEAFLAMPPMTDDSSWYDDLDTSILLSNTNTGPTTSGLLEFDIPQHDYQMPTDSSGLSSLPTFERQANEETLDHKRYPQWYIDQSKSNKIEVNRKMSMLWYGKSDRPCRNLTRYYIAKYFTPEEFLQVLHADENDAVVRHIAEMTSGGKARALQMSKTKATSLEDNDGDAGDGSRPDWYADLDYDAKKYVINRMCFLWYKDFDDMALRRKARSKIFKRFTIKDFNAAADPKTDYDTMLEIANRTRGKEVNERDREIRAMKKKLKSSGLAGIRTIDRLVKYAVEKEGYDQKSIDELENRVVRGWSGHPTFEAWLQSRNVIRLE